MRLRNQSGGIGFPSGGDRFEHLFRATSANEVRAARRRGVTVVEGGLELLAEFEPLWNETYSRLEAQPTHTRGELHDLLERLPDRIRIFCARLDGETVAATLALLLNDVVAYSFYHVMRADRANINGQKVIFAHMIDRLADSGYNWFDLGPSASLRQTTDGVVFFKEGLGGSGHLRTSWLWETP